MARRRRKGNPLLTRILIISLVAHAIALPIAAHFGAFAKIQRQFGTSRVVMVSLPPVAPERPKSAEKKAVKREPTAKKSGHAAPKAAAQRSSLPQPKVVAAGATGDGAGGGPTVDANASGKAGSLPTPPPTVPPKAASPTPEAPAAPVPKPEAPAVEPKPKEAPATEPKPEPKPVAPKPRKIVEAEVLEAPLPTIPDDLRAEPFDKTLVVEADVDSGGHPTNVRVVESTGMRGLDDSGLAAAKRYRFRPATIDGAPTEQHVRFRIHFKVT